MIMLKLDKLEKKTTISYVQYTEHDSIVISWNIKHLNFYTNSLHMTFRIMFEIMVFFVMALLAWLYVRVGVLLMCV